MESQKIRRKDAMLYGVHIFHSKQLPSMVCNFPEIYSPAEADPWSESSASSELSTDPRSLHGTSILHPPVQSVLSACVRASSVLGCHFAAETSADTKALCAVSAKPGPVEGRRHRRNTTSCVKGLPAVPGLRGAGEFLNSSLPPSRSCTARCWDQGHSLTSCRKQGKQQLLHLRGLMTRITSRPALSAILMVKALMGAHSLRSKQPFSSTAK